MGRRYSLVRRDASFVYADWSSRVILLLIYISFLLLIKMFQRTISLDVIILGGINSHLRCYLRIPHLVLLLWTYQIKQQWPCLFVIRH